MSGQMVLMLEVAEIYIYNGENWSWEELAVPVPIPPQPGFWVRADRPGGGSPPDEEVISPGLLRPKGKDSRI